MRTRVFLRPGIGAALVILYSTGCSIHPAPIETDLSADPPQHWASPTTVPEDQETSSIPIASAWWESFGDSRLNQLVAEALARNTDLRVAASRVAAAEARARIAGADLRPQIGADLSARRGRQNFIGLPIPGSDGKVLSTTTTNLGASLNISWEADLWGRLRAAKASSMADFTASELDLAAAQLSLAGQTAKSWFAILEADGQVGVARGTLDSRRVTLERIRRRYNAGLAEPLELRFAVSDHALAESLLAERERRAEDARRALQLIIYRYPSGELDATTTDVALPSVSRSVPAGLPAELVTRRPDLAAAESRLAAAGYSVTAARRSLYPRLTLTGSAGAVSTEVEDLLDQDFSVWSLAGGLFAPLFQGGRLRAGIDLAEARQQETLAMYLQQTLGAFAEVEASLSAAGYLERREVALLTAVEQADEALSLAQDRYAAGLTTYLAVLESQRQALNAQSQFLSVRRQLLDTRIDLYLALGGGWGSSASGSSSAAGSSSALPESTTTPQMSSPQLSSPRPSEGTER